MSYIITSKCVDTCDAACVRVCPVDCIHGPIDPNGGSKELDSIPKDERKGMQLYINPDVCITCGACLPECPVDAITEDEVWAIKIGEEESVHKNYEFFGQKYKPMWKASE
jgi:ferredoxin